MISKVNQAEVNAFRRALDDASVSTPDARVLLNLMRWFFKLMAREHGWE